MRSPNCTVFLLVGFYDGLFLFRHDCITLVGGQTVFLLMCCTVLPAILVIRKRFYRALSLLGITVLFTVSMLIIHRSSWSVVGLVSTVNKLAFPFLVFVFVLLPGLFMVAELDPDRLPHEISHWSGLRIFIPLVAIFAARERFLRRLAVIRENWVLRGLEVRTPFQHIRNFGAWIVPLATATICEAGYAYTFRRMVNSAHFFVPTRPKKPILSRIQKVFVLLLLLYVLIGIQRIIGHE